MSLKYIISEVASAMGFHPDTVPDDRFYLANQINKACKEMHEGRDLVNCNREQLFSMSSQDQLVALPHYVFQLRGVRNYYTRKQITLHDMRPRFQSSGWTENLLNFRDKNRSPIMNEILNQGPLMLSIEKAEAADFSVYVSGSTVKSARVTETVTFVAGDLQHQTTNAFVTVESIANSVQHTYDVTVQDIDGNTMAVLPNSEFNSDYRIVQILDYIATAPSSPYMVEVLYKIRFQPMVNDGDEFCCPGYDDAIIWKVLSYLYARKDASKAVLADSQCKKIMSDMANDNEAATEKMIEFAVNQSLYPFSRARRWNKSLFPGAYS